MQKDSSSAEMTEVATVAEFEPIHLSRVRWYRTRWVARILTSAALLLVGFVAGVGVTSLRLDGGGVGAQSSFLDAPEFQVLQEVWDLAHTEYVERSSIDDADLIFGAAAGMVGALGDENHSRFLAPEEVVSYERALRNELIGIGVYLNYLGPEPVITRPIEGGPAIAAGIKANDVIVAVDDVPTKGLDSVTVGESIRGEPGTDVSIEIFRPDTGETLTFELVRKQITIAPVSWGMLPNGVAHIRLSQFSGGSLDGMRDAIAGAKEAGATSIILDLRDNPGGLVAEAIGIASEFLPINEVVFKQQNQDGVISPKRALEGQSAVDFPVVVLINENSASAAEILAGAIRDNDRGILIGETTLGTGTVLTQYNVSNGASVLLGTTLWLTAGGDQIWKVGVEPDEEVALPTDILPTDPGTDTDVTADELAETGDSQLIAAFESITGTADPAATPVASPVASPAAD